MFWCEDDDLMARLFQSFAVSLQHYHDAVIERVVPFGKERDSHPIGIFRPVISTWLSTALTVETIQRRLSDSLYGPPQTLYRL